MSKIIISFALSICIILSVCTHLSFTSGPKAFGAGDVTGSTAGVGTCKNCHFGGSDTTTSSLEIRLKSAGPTSSPVNNYIPNNTYLVTITGANKSQPFYGFQVTAIDDNNNYIGGFKNIPNNADGQPFNAPEIVEHNTRIPKDTSGKFTVSFNWTPKDSFGKVRFYGIVNAVNGDVKTTDDTPGESMLVTLTGPLSVNNLNTHRLNIYPSPFKNLLFINFSHSIERYINIINQSGQIFYSTNTRSDKTIINTNTWPEGMYIVEVNTMDRVQYTKVVK